MSRSTYRTRHHRVEWCLGQALTERQQSSVVIERLERRQVGEGARHGLGARCGRHKVEAREVVDPQRLELQQVRREIAPHQLRRRPARQCGELRRREQTEALARRRASCAAGALVERRLRRGHHGEHVHPRRPVELLDFGKACINDVDDAVNRDTRFSDVGREDDFACTARRGQKHAVLLIGRETRIEREEEHGQRPGRKRRIAVVQCLHRRLNLVAPGEEDEQVTERLREVHIPRGLNGRLHVVVYGGGGVGDLHRVAAPLEREERDVLGRLAGVRRIEVARKRLGIDCRARHNDAQLGAHLADLLE